MCEDRNFRIDAGLIFTADDIEHAADGVATLARILEHLDVDDVAGLCAVRFAARNQHLGTRLATLEHEIDAALTAKLPDDARFAARENLDDAPFPAAARVAGTRCDAIAVPEQLHLARGEIEIIATVVGPEKTEPVAMREYDTRHEVEMPRQAVLVGAVPEQLAVTHHGAHAGLERAPVLFRVDLETWREGLESERLPGLLHRREDLVAARDLVLVAPFVGGAGVLRAARHQE